MNLKLITLAAAAAITLGAAGSTNANTSSTDVLQFGNGGHVAPIAYRHCYPRFGVRRVHLSGSSRIIFVRRIVGWKCLPILVKRPRLPIPDPGPYGRLPGRKGGFVSPRTAR
jgi:hypothetical protein